MQARRRDRSGFTYLELTITILVMGILAGVAAPSYRGAVSRYRVDLAAQRLVADLQFARSEAQRSSQSRTVQFNTGSDSYTLENVAHIDERALAYSVNLVDDPFLASLVSTSFGAGDRVTFDRFGRPDNSGSIVLQSGGVQVTVNLAADGTASKL